MAAHTCSGWRRSLQQRAAVILAQQKGDAFGEIMAGPEGGPGAAVPLRVGFVVFVPLVLDHPEAADADVRPGHLHPVQSDPARGEERGGGERQRTDRPAGNASGGKYVVVVIVSMFCGYYTFSNLITPQLCCWWRLYFSTQATITPGEKKKQKTSPVLIPHEYG